MSLFWLQEGPDYYKPRGHTAANILNEFADALVYAGIFVFLILRPFVLQTFFIPSGSMVQTLQVNDLIVANKFIYRISDPKRGDVVVFQPPKRALFEGQEDVDFIKRCIGVPGDLIEIKNQQLYRNGQLVKEEYVSYTKEDPDAPGVRFLDLSDEEIAMHSFSDFWFVQDKGRVLPLNVRPEGFVNTGDMSIADDFRVEDPAEMSRLRSLPAIRIPAGYYLMLGDNRYHSYDGRGWGLVPRESIVGRAEYVWFPIRRMRSIH